MGSLSPPSSTITNSSINLDLTLCDPSQNSVLEDEIQETRDVGRTSFKLFGFTINVDNVKETPTSESQDIEYVKELTKSDVDGCSRLMIKKQFVKDKVIPLMNDAEREQVHSEDGYHVAVFDVDTSTEHHLKFKLWKSSNTYVFTEWSKHFLKRRNLKQGDRISLSWSANKFHFSVLERAIQKDKVI